MSPEVEKAKTVSTHGGRNLIILGLAAAVITITTTSISLFIYHSTGDIYLDRSRPGFIAEGEKHDNEEDGNEEFSSDGIVDSKTLDEYLKELESVEGRINAHENDFDAEQLSDDALGIYVYSEELTEDGD